MSILVEKTFAPFVEDVLERLSVSVVGFLGLVFCGRFHATFPGALAHDSLLFAPSGKTIFNIAFKLNVVPNVWVGYEKLGH